MPIASFADRKTEDFFFKGKIAKRVGWRDVSKVAKRKLDMLNFAKELRDLKVPPSNRLEALRGDLKGYYSIRINDRWRVVFRWEKSPEDVQIMDYH